MEVGIKLKCGCIYYHIERTAITFRMSSKLQVFLMLPVLFMGTVPTLYHPLTKLAHAVVLLIGRVMSERFRRANGYVCELRCAMYVSRVSRVDSYHIYQIGTEHVSITYSKVISRWPR